MRKIYISKKGDWADVARDCYASMGKAERAPLLPPKEWVKKILIAEHSPIRRVTWSWEWKGIPYWVAMHFKTHIWYSLCTSQRNDRQHNYDRTKAPQDAPVDMLCEANAQHLIDTSRKRLCRLASPETRSYWENVKLSMWSEEGEMSDVMVPNCVYRCGCPEMKPCGWYDTMVAKHPLLRSTNIQERYDEYNRIFFGGETK